jgi:site-specific DNA recombinase
MNIAIYARVSSEKQAKDGTIQSQIEALREYAKAHNLTVVQECIDNGFSGADLNRPGLDQLRDLAQEGLIEGVLLLSPDRLSRKQAHQIILMEEFQKRKVQVFFTTQHFGDSPEDRLMLQIQGSISEYEQAKISDRTRRGTKHAVKKGQVLGTNAPFGYRFVPKTDKTLAHWKVNPQEAEVVRRIYHLYLKERLKGSTIARLLEEEGIPSRSNYKKWWPSLIYSVLKIKTYTGVAQMYKTRKVEPKKSAKINQYRHNKKSSKENRPKEDWIAIPVTPIIDNQTWEAAQERLKLNGLHSKRNNLKNEYLLRGMVVCGLCGCMAPGTVSNKNTYYSCGAKRNRNITTKPHDERISIQHPLLDQNVWDGLVSLLEDPENLKAQLHAKLDNKNIIPAFIPPTYSKMDKDLEKLDVQEKRILDAYREAVITLDELKEQKSKIANNRKVLEAKKKAALSQQESISHPEITMDMLGDVSARYRRVMANAEFATREKLVNLLINSVTIYPHKAVVKGNIPVITADVLIPSNHIVPLLTHMSNVVNLYLDRSQPLFECIK